jgi:hypothetical protein
LLAKQIEERAYEAYGCADVNEDQEKKKAKVYSEGCLVPQDDSAAFMWFVEAAKQGEPTGIIQVGKRLIAGVGVAQDVVAARAWLVPMAFPESTTDPDGMHAAQAWLSATYAVDAENADLVQAYMWINLAVAYAPVHAFFFHMSKAQAVENRETLANRMDPAQIQEAQREAAVLYIPLDEVRRRCLGEEAFKRYTELRCRLRGSKRNDDE